MNRRGFLAGSASLVAAPVNASQKLGNAKAIAGDRFRIGADEYHLVDIIAPSEYDLHRDAQPFFSKARAILDALIADTALEIIDTGARNRWGARQVSARRVGDTSTLPERLVAKGAARVAPTSDDGDLIDRLLSAEKSARANAAGLWGLRAYQVVDAANAARAIGAYHLIEGEVKTARAVRSRFYLNFGEDYREDFTASVRSRRARTWARVGLDLETLQNVRVRVRGFVDRINGPSVELTHIKAIERLD